MVGQPSGVRVYQPTTGSPAAIPSPFLPVWGAPGGGGSDNEPADLADFVSTLGVSIIDDSANGILISEEGGAGGITLDDGSASGIVLSEIGSGGILAYDDGGGGINLIETGVGGISIEDLLVTGSSGINVYSRAQVAAHVDGTTVRTVEGVNHLQSAILDLQPGEATLSATAGIGVVLSDFNGTGYGIVLDAYQGSPAASVARLTVGGPGGNGVSGGIEAVATGGITLTDNSTLGITLGTDGHLLLQSASSGSPRLTLYAGTGTPTPDDGIVIHDDFGSIVINEGGGGNIAIHATGNGSGINLVADASPFSGGILLQTAANGVITIQSTGSGAVTVETTADSSGSLNLENNGTGQLHITGAATGSGIWITDGSAGGVNLTSTAAPLILAAENGHAIQLNGPNSFDHPIYTGYWTNTLPRTLTSYYGMYKATSTGTLTLYAAPGEAYDIVVINASGGTITLAAPAGKTIVDGTTGGPTRSMVAGEVTRLTTDEWLNYYVVSSYT